MPGFLPNNERSAVGQIIYTGLANSRRQCQDSRIEKFMELKSQDYRIEKIIELRCQVWGYLSVWWGRCEVASCNDWSVERLGSRVQAFWISRRNLTTLLPAWWKEQLKLIRTTVRAQGISVRATYILPAVKLSIDSETFIWPIQPYRRFNMWVTRGRQSSLMSNSSI